ncbi:MAG: hypothetical protein HGGPFJEG_02091 [Ignavibacteria bacterium]|nr:hypothetical protein [Ignavibacteria bacterium]
MLKRYKNKLSMLEGLYAYLSDFESILTANSGIALVYADLGKKINEIRSIENLRLNVLSGKSDAKNSNRFEITNAGFAYASKLYDYAVKTDNQELKSQNEFTRSEILKMRDSELLIKLQNISANIESNIEGLISYGINPDKAEEFKQKITEYGKSVENLLSSRAIKTSAGKTIDVLFSESDSILKSLDMMAEEYRKSDFSFFNGYRSARNIKDMGKRYKQNGEQIPVNAVVQSGNNLTDASENKIVQS